MAKIYHEHVARVMQEALSLFRRYNGGETVETICASRGMAMSRSKFYLV